MALVSVAARVFTFQPTLTPAQFDAASALTLLRRMLAASITYFGVAGVFATLIHRFHPRLWVQLHRVQEVRALLDYGSLRPLLRHLAEMAVELCMCILARRHLAWVQAKFPTAIHALVSWRSSWAATTYTSSVLGGTELPMDRGRIVSLIADAPALVVAACCSPSGNDICTSLWSLYTVLTGTCDIPAKRALLNDVFTYPPRYLIALLSGYTASRTHRVWLRMLTITLWFCVDVFALRSLIVPKLLDTFAPFEVPKRVAAPGDNNNNGPAAAAEEREAFEPFGEEDAARPPAFADEADEQEARMMLLRVDAEQLHFVHRFAFDCVQSEHCRGSVKAEAARLLRYAAILNSNPATDNGLDLDEIGRVASVYGADDEQFEMRGVDEEHRLCVICMNAFEQDEKVASVRKCSHSFHFHCIQQWWSQHNSCPLCNEQLMTERTSSGSGLGAGAGGMEEGAAAAHNNNNNENDALPAVRRRRGGQQRQQQEGQQEDLHSRFYRLLMRAKVEPERMSYVEWGPVAQLYYAIGSLRGANAVRDLRNFEGSKQWQESQHDWLAICIVNLFFVIPQWARLQ